MFLVFLLKHYEIIETYWNVNFDPEPVRKNDFDEIIETYWNVNNQLYLLPDNGREEIIETYWNVNVIILFELDFWLLKK